MLLHSVNYVQENTSSLLTARQVQSMFGVDRSTVYRMAAHGTLPAVKFGRQWRFPADRIAQLALEADRGAGDSVERARDSAPTVPVEVADAVVAVCAALLGVTMVVTDMQGRPITGLANACDRLSSAGPGSGVVSQCLDEWHELAQEVDLEPRFQRGPMGFECARAFVRAGTELVAMVVAGGIAPQGTTDGGLHRLDAGQRSAVLAALPRIAAALSRAAAGRCNTELSVDVEHAVLHRTDRIARSEARQTVEVSP